VSVLSFQRGRRYRPGNGTRLESINDIQGMGFVDGLYRLDAKAR
jgi:hypothetical protein